jgi:hypothetical protein
MWTFCVASAPSGVGDLIDALSLAYGKLGFVMFLKRLDRDAELDSDDRLRRSGRGVSDDLAALDIGRDVLAASLAHDEFSFVRMDCLLRNRPFRAF